MATVTITIHDIRQRHNVKVLADKAPAGTVVTFKEAGEARTAAQNRLIHRWFSEIARDHSIGLTAAEVKAECNLTYGLPIMLRDDAEWADAFSVIFNSLNYESKVKAIRVLDVPFTRRMKVKQLSEYMDQMQRDYAEMGVRLTDPELRKYEGAAA